MIFRVQSLAPLLLMFFAHSAFSSIISVSFGEMGDRVNEGAGTVFVDLEWRLEDEQFPSESCTISGALGVAASDSTADQGEDFTIQQPNFTFSVIVDNESEGVPFAQPVSVALQVVDDTIGQEGQATEGGFEESIVLDVNSITSNCDLNRTIFSESDTLWIVDNDEAQPEPEPEPQFDANLQNSQGLTEKQRRTAEVLDQACSAIESQGFSRLDQQDLYDSCVALQNSENIAAGLDQLAPTALAPMGLLGMQSSHQQAENISQHLSRVRRGLRAVDTSGLTFNVNGQYLPGRTLGAGAGDVQSNWGTFIGGNVTVGESDTSSFDIGADNLYFGVDYLFSDRWVGGAAVGYTQSDITHYTGENTIEYTDANVSIFTSFYPVRNFYLDAIFSYADSEYSTERYMNFGAINQFGVADTKGAQLTSAVNLGYTFNFSRFYLNLVSAVEYVEISIDELRESARGNTNNQGVLVSLQDQDFESFKSNLGVELGWTINTSVAVFAPKLIANWEHQYRNDPLAIDSAYIGDPTQTVLTLEDDLLDDSFYNAGLAINAIFPNGLSAYLLYDTDLKRDYLDSYSVNLGVKFEF
ncbi:autotransporter outer membrane beta-barrel domain-containing protein [Aurantivibrio plasticivorans]